MSAIKTLHTLKKKGGSGQGGLWKKRGVDQIEPLEPAYNNVYCPNNLYVANQIEITSDEKLKMNIENIPRTDLDKIMQIQPKQYEFKADPDKVLRYGVIAQQIEQLFPNLVSTPATPDLPKTVHYLDIIPLLLLKVQDLQEQIDELKK